MKLSISEIKKRIGLMADNKDNCVIDTLLTDSRSLSRPDSTLFFAINTPGGNDGHRYIRDLYSRGVRHFAVSHIPEDAGNMPDADFIVTDDTVATLQRIASWHPDFSGKILAITGSRGKTTLKEWLFQLLEDSEQITRSPRSYNSQTGVPLSMWEITPSTSLAIIEAGISRRGEMTPLAECIRPDTVIFTNIGDEHSDGFNSIYEKAAEKALLAAGSQTSDIILELDNRILLEAIAQAAPGKRLTTWSLTDTSADLFMEIPSIFGIPTEITYTFKGERHSLKAPVENRADLENTASALTFMLMSGISPELAAKRFASLHKIGTRLNVSEGISNCSVIYDSYTSDFSSLGPALDFTRRRAMPSQSLTLIMSDIRHEDSNQEDVYGRIARLVADSGTGRFIGVGRSFKEFSRFFGRNAVFFDSTDEFLANLGPADFSDEIILLKGAPEFGFARILEMLEARTHETVLEVNLDSIVKNFNYFRKHIPSSTGIVAMVKASAYGAGSVEIAKTLQDAGAAYLAVAVLDEGIELRRNGIHLPIMVMNPKVMNYRSMFINRLEPEIYTFDMLADVIREARKCGIKKYPVHVKLDTGMHRTGFTGDELPALIDMLETQEEVEVCSAFSHLATADCLDMDDYTELQLSRFEEYTEYMLSRLKRPFLRHILNSAGILRFPSHHYDLVRLGIGLYGVNTLPPESERPLAVVSTLRTMITALHDREPGETIGYGRHGKITRPSAIATIPIGYADGMNRHFGQGRISVMVNGKPAPTIGNICMDACMIDVTGIDCKVGDPVVIFGEDASVQRLADALDTIPYEILTSVSPRVKRIYYRE